MSELKYQMHSHFEFFMERCTGFFLGPLICVTYHSGWEWNRRITNQENTAIGFVKRNGDGTDIRFIILKGMLAPQYFIPLLLMACAFYLLICFLGQYSQDVIRYCFPVCLAITAAAAVLDAVKEYMTEESHEGSRILKSILKDPSDPFSYLNNKNEF